MENKTIKRLMISIHPEWAEKILNGEKTIEVRPWIPKGELPIEVLMYVTKGEQLERHWTKSLPLSKQFILYGNKVKIDRLSSPHCLNGKVVAKFTLNKVEDFNPKLGHPKIYVNACLSDTELAKVYPNKNILFAWHIEKLEIFDKPKELSEFYVMSKQWWFNNKKWERTLDRKIWLCKAPQKCVWVEK